MLTGGDRARPLRLLEACDTRGLHPWISDDGAARGSGSVFIVCTCGRPGRGYDLPLAYFVRVMVDFSSIMVLRKGWFPIDGFFTLSGVSFKLIVALSS